MQLSDRGYISKVLVERSKKVGDCWLWQRAKTGSGYGVFQPKGYPKMQLAHRVSYEIFNGTIPENRCICHSCDTPSCINPAHLWTGTVSDNQKDSYTKRRSWISKRVGDNHPNAKLSTFKAEEIRNLYRLGLYDQYQLSSKYGVHRNVISAVVNRRIWK